MAPSRRHVLGNLLGTGILAGIAGCSGFPFIGSDGSDWTDWLHEPEAARYLSAIGDAPVSFDFEYSEPATILDHRSAIADVDGGTPALDRYEATHAPLGMDPASIDRWTETGSVVHGTNSLRAIRLRLIDGRFEREAIRRAFSGIDRPDHQGWERYANPDGTRAIGIDDRRIVIAEVLSGDRDALKRPIEGAVRRAIDVVEGNRPPSIENDRHARAVAASLNDPLHARGSTRDEPFVREDGLRATGGGSVDPKDRQYRWVGVFENAEAIPTDDLRELLNAGFETWESVDRSGRVLTVTGRVPPELWLG